MNWPALIATNNYHYDRDGDGVTTWNPGGKQTKIAGEDKDDNDPKVGALTLAEVTP